MKVQFCVGKVSAEGFNYFHKCDPVLKDLIYLLIGMFLNDGNLLTSPVIGWLSGLVVGHRISIWSGRVAEASQTTSPDYRSRRLGRKKVLNVKHTKNMNGKDEEQKIKINEMFFTKQGNPITEQQDFCVLQVFLF